jgi:hypothetical protein
MKLRKKTSIPQTAPPLCRMQDGALYLDDTQYKRIPARLTSLTSVAIPGQTGGESPGCSCASLNYPLAVQKKTPPERVPDGREVSLFSVLLLFSFFAFLMD